jgi:enoyl-CoA hydratase
MDGAEDLVLLDRHGAVAVLTIQRPKALNALNAAVLARLAERLEQIAADRSIGAVVLTGSGDRAFVAGADIAEMLPMDAAAATAFAARGAAVLAAIGALPQAVIAAVNGFALGGGCELALACDIVVASSRAKLGLPEVSLGVIPGFGGTQRLTRQIGRHAAKRWTLSGDVFSAEEALRYGVVQEVHPPEELLAKAIELAGRIASRGPLAVAAAKRVIDAGADEPLAVAIGREGQAFGACFATADQREGMGAFVDKRPPSFRGQ